MNGQARIVLSARKVTKHFGGVAALNNVTLSIHEGEHVALVGDNGAGKSTLVGVLSGAVQPDSGEISVDGKVCTLESPEHARQVGIETVYQDLAIVDQLDSIANVFLGRELVRLKAGWLSVLSKREMESQATSLLQRLGVQIPNLHTPLRHLSGGQRQGVAIARAAGWGNHMVIMDEPTAALGVQEKRKVEKIIGDLKQSGVAALIVSHDLRQVFDLVDRVCVLRHGRVVGDTSVGRTSHEEVVRMITGAG